MPAPLLPRIARFRLKSSGGVQRIVAKPAEKIETERLLLRRLRMNDVQSIYVYARDVENIRYLPFRPHLCLDDTINYVKYARQAWRAGREYVYAIIRKSDRQFLGTIGFENEDGKACLGYVIAKSYWNCGYASEAARAVVNDLFGKRLFDRIWAFCDADNGPSRRVLIKAGLREEAIIRNWVRFVNQNNEFKDCVFYALVQESTTNHNT